MRPVAFLDTPLSDVCLLNCYKSAQVKCGMCNATGNLQRLGCGGNRSHVSHFTYCIPCITRAVSLVLPVPTPAPFCPSLLNPPPQSHCRLIWLRGPGVQWLRQWVHQSHSGSQTVFAAFCSKSVYSSTVDSPALSVLISYFKNHVVSWVVNWIKFLARVY